MRGGVEADGLECTSHFLYHPCILFPNDYVCFIKVSIINKKKKICKICIFQCALNILNFEHYLVSQLHSN